MLFCGCPLLFVDGCVLFVGVWCVLMFVVGCVLFPACCWLLAAVWSWLSVVFGVRSMLFVASVLCVS